MHKCKHIINFTFAVVLSLLGLSANAAYPSYTFTDLGTLGGTISYATAINASGHIAGYAFLADDINHHATLWNDSVINDLGTLGGSLSAAYGINNTGQVVGYAQTSGNTNYNATIWNADSVTNLGTTSNDSFAYSINNAGNVAGRTNLENAGFGATIWNEASAISLGSLGGRDSQANAINNNDQAVGLSYTNTNFYFHATKWNGANATDLGTLGGNYSRAMDINDAGQVVGWSTPSGDSVNGVFAGHATLWNEGSIIDLGTLGGTGSGANAINNAGQIVGYSLMSGDLSYHATLWDGTSIVDLNNLLDANTVSAGWVLNDARGINDNGWIVGNASNKLQGVYSRAFLLSPVPEPESYLMMLIGISCVVGISRRKKFKSAVHLN